MPKAGRECPYPPPARAVRTDQLVSRDTPAALSASPTGWKKVWPPDEQLPEPPEVMPWACEPARSEPPESPGSAQTSVWMRPETLPSA